MKLSIYHPRSFCYDQLTPTVTETGVAGSEETLINYCIYIRSFNITPVVYTQYIGPRLCWQGGFWENESLFFEHTHECVLSWSDNIDNLQRIRGYPGDGVPLLTRFVNHKPFPEFNAICKVSTVVLSQSEWILNHYQNRPANIVMVTNGLGIEPDFSRGFANNRIIYGSDYERGLICLLESWPFLRSINPDLQLSICYGWQIFDNKYAGAGSNEYAQNFKRRIEVLMSQKGVTHYGRVGHDQLQDIIIHSDYWMYPCNFPENCSTLSLKMQSQGVWPIIISSGGLSETVTHGFKSNTKLWYDGRPPTSENVLEAYNEWVQGAISTLNNPPKIEERVLMMKMTFDNYAYSKVVKDLARAIFKCVV